MHFFTIAALAVSQLAAHTNADEFSTFIDAKSNYGSWDGWGTSLAWWARRFGDRDDIADIFFTTNDVPWQDSTLPGLGLNIVRHNAGASSFNTIEGKKMSVSRKMILSRQIEGHWVDWYSEDPTSNSWNWDVDANQRSMLLKAKARGANRFELFSNSPMWWMTRNQNPSGYRRNKENIQPWNIPRHALYMATIAKWAKDHWNITFDSVNPFNEPSGSSWTSSGTQEGCRFYIPTQSTIILALRQELDSRGLHDTIVAASDESKIDRALNTLRWLSNDALKTMGRINVHGYQYDEGKRHVLRDIARQRGHGLWNTEYGENDASGKGVLINVFLDFRYLQAQAWVYWQVLDGKGWGLIEADNEKGTLGPANQKYFIVAQFSRHIREGMRILDGGADNIIAAYDEAKSKLVIVAVNWWVPQYFNFDLSSFSQPSTHGANVTRWRTQTGEGDRYVKAEDTFMDGSKFWSYFESGMVQTFEIENVKL